MQIKRVRLGNIRSYTAGEITFPSGSTLLSGNIGSGKSTVLMAVEFALFGLKKGSEMTGSALLRNGADKGSVELELEIDGKKVVIGRTLKRTATGVSQEAGFLEINSERQALTAVELKQKVLGLINYPAEMLSKNDMLFRHTVYVSQEEMKQILLGDRESRLNALRYVFGIDRFKRIRENADVISRKAGEKKREIAGYIADLELKKADEVNKKNELGLLKEGVSLLLPSIEKADGEARVRKEKVILIEDSIRKAAEIKSKLSIADEKHRMTDFQNRRDILELNRIDEKMKLAAEKPSGNDFLSIINYKKIELKAVEAKLNEISSRIYALKADRKRSEALKEKMHLLENCPTCMQKVEANHKEQINSDENRKIEEIEKELGMHLRNEPELKAAAEKLNDDIEKIRDEEKKDIVLKARLKEAEEALKQKEMIEARVKDNELLLKQLADEKIMLAEEFKLHAGHEKEYLAEKMEFEKASKALNELEVKKAGFDAKIAMLGRIIESTSAEIARKEMKKKELESLSDLRQWIDEYFMSLAESMEKTVMAKAHSDFSGLLEKWFSMLVDNETMAIRLDEEFSPVIEQNGYETDYLFLSGGEKTAAALAYRLALNQVVNNMMSEIRTRDLIILDEPTDGFSEQQLEKMKDVLEELNISQVIIVSHEQKIESFVENVIRFQKKAHESSINQLL